MNYYVYTREEGEKMAEKKREYSQAQNKATQKYIKANYDEIKIRMKKGKKEEYQNYAQVKGESLNGLIIRTLDEAMERDNESSIINDNKTLPNTPEATPTKSTPGQSKHRTGDEIDRFLEQWENKTRTAPDTSEPQSIEPDEPAEQIKPSIIDNNETQPLNNDDSDFMQSIGFTKEDLQKSNEAAERWKANQANKKKEKQDRMKMRMVAINQFDGVKEGE